MHLPLYFSSIKLLIHIFIRIHDENKFLHIPMFLNIKIALYGVRFVVGLTVSTNTRGWSKGAQPPSSHKLVSGAARTCLIDLYCHSSALYFYFNHWHSDKYWLTRIILYWRSIVTIVTWHMPTPVSYNSMSILLYIHILFLYLLDRRFLFFTSYRRLELLHSKYKIPFNIPGNSSPAVWSSRVGSLAPHTADINIVVVWRTVYACSLLMTYAPVFKCSHSHDDCSRLCLCFLVYINRIGGINIRNNYQYSSPMPFEVL